ncbi:hypothetical protein [Williamsia limnetica]|nr:hypothetical protein [Williamsia limnetica]
MVKRLVAPAAVAVSAFVAMVVLMTRLGGGSSLFENADAWRVLFEGDTACVTLAAVIAVVVGSVLRDRAIAVAIGCTGLVLIGVVAAIGTSASWSSYGLAVAAGLVIAAVALVAAHGTDRSVLQACLVGGALAAIWVARQLQQNHSEVYAFGDYTPVGRPTDWQLLIGASIALALLAGSWFTREAPSVTSRLVGAASTGRIIILGIAIPVAALLLWWWFVGTEILGDNTDTGTTTWAYGFLLVPLAVGGVLWLPGRDGLVLLAVLVTMAAVATVPRWQGSWPLPVVFVALIVVGILTGRRWPSPLIAMGVLLVCTSVTVIDQSPWDFAGIVAAFVVPAIGGHVVAASLPTTAGLSTVAVTAPATLAAMTVISVGWVAYGSSSPSGFDEVRPSTTELVISVATIVACAAAAAVVLRRTPSADANLVRE